MSYCDRRPWLSREDAQPIADAMWLSATEAIGLLMRAKHDGSVLLPGAEYPIAEVTLRERWQKSRPLFLDDIGVAGFTPPQYAALLEILDLRSNRPTVFTGNFDPAELAKELDGRVVSRVCSGLIIEVTGRDERLAAAEMA